MIFALTLIRLAFSDICSEVPFLWDPASLPLKTDDAVVRTGKCADRLTLFSSRVTDSNWKSAYTALLEALSKFPVDERPAAVDVSRVAVDESDERILLTFGPAFQLAQSISQDSFTRVLGNPSEEEISKVLEVAHLQVASIMRVCASQGPLAERWRKVCPSCSVNAAYNHLSAGELYFLSRHKIGISVKIARTTGEPLRDGSMANFPVELAPLRAFLCMRFQVECAEMYALVAPIRAASSMQLDFLRSHFKRSIFKEKFLAMVDPKDSPSLGLDWEWRDLVEEVDLRLLKMFANADRWPMFMRMLRQVITRSQIPMLEGQAIRADVAMIIAELWIGKSRVTQLFVQKVWNLCRTPEYSATPNCLNLQMRLETADITTARVPTFVDMSELTEKLVTEKARNFVTAAMPERAAAEGILSTTIQRFIDTNTVRLNLAGEACSGCLEMFTEDLAPCVICHGSGDFQHFMCSICTERHIRLSMQSGQEVACPICRRIVHF